MRVILNLGLPSFLLNTVLSLLCCTQESTNTVVANTVTTTAHTEDEHSTKKNLALVNTKQQFHRSTSILETQIPTIAKQLSNPRLQNLFNLRGFNISTIKAHAMQIKTRHQTSFHTELGDTGFISATHFHNIFF